MRQSGFRAWKALGGLAAVALLGVGCGYLPVTGGRQAGDPPLGFWGNHRHDVPPDFYARFHSDPNRGYNGTIQDVGSSIDPRTPETAGASGQSRQVDVTGRAPPESPMQGIGGSGRAGDPGSSSDLGWRARLPYEVGPVRNPGYYGKEREGW
ncbi:hypothetical protein [Hyalangium gracile]|uniref:hypothetical protein n=1 Tax=Hyalangium gracile TaxID=394092 RepID=UPI001CCB9DB3|nr:hypothetical protein [Hyalangium gracile]